MHKMARVLLRALYKFPQTGATTPITN